MVRPLNQFPVRVTRAGSTEDDRMPVTTQPASTKLKTSHRVFPAGPVASTVTPFTHDGGLQLDRVKPHVDWLIAEGVQGLSPLGSSGEFVAVEAEDRKRVLEAVIAANDSRLPVWAGTHHYSTRATIELSRHAAQAGADALLIVPPYYMAPTAEQTMDHYRRIADAVDLPVVLYHNIPLTCVDLRNDQLLALFEE